MLKYISESEYEKLLDVDSIPENFKQLAIQASKYINLRTFGRIDVNNIPEEVKYLTCLLVDLLNEENSKLKEIGSLKSQNIEGWSETYSTADEIKKDYSDKKESLLKEFLWDKKGNDGNYLLYRGE